MTDNEGVFMGAISARNMKREVAYGQNYGAAGKVMRMRSLLPRAALVCFTTLILGVPGCSTTSGIRQSFQAASSATTSIAQPEVSSRHDEPVPPAPDLVTGEQRRSAIDSQSLDLPPAPGSGIKTTSYPETPPPSLPPGPDDPAALASPPMGTERTIVSTMLAPPSMSRAAPAERPVGDTPLESMSPILRNRLEGLDGGNDDEDEFNYPDIHSDPGQRYHEQFGTDPDYDRFLLPSIVNLIYEDRWLLAEKDPAKALKNQLQRRLKVDIRDPDPDTANFPNGAYTLPKGRMYIENSPLGLYGASRSGNQPRVYQWEYLIRYGLTDNLEFRIFSNGLTDQAAQGRQPAILGYSPLAFDFKANFWEENTKYHIPAMGVEIYLETNLLGSSAFNTGTQPSINLLFDQSLPYDIGFEYNLGITGAQDNLGQIAYQFSYQWSFQREVAKDFDVFIHGFYNAAALPRLSKFQSAARETIPSVTVMGLGGIWTVNNRLSVFGSYNFGMSFDSPTTIALMGFAVAM